jgi:hypothetical protein
MAKKLGTLKIKRLFMGRDSGNRGTEVTASAAELNIMDGVTATAAEINLAADGVGAVVSLTDDVDITQALHAGRICTLDKVGGLTATLPEATGTGDVYTFIVGTALTSSTYVIVTPDLVNADITGVANTFDADNANIWEIFVAKQSDGYDTITMDMTTQGGITIGFDKVVLTDIKADVWASVVTLYTPAGSEPATPFSTTN